MRRDRNRQGLPHYAYKRQRSGRLTSLSGLRGHVRAPRAPTPAWSAQCGSSLTSSPLVPLEHERSRRTGARSSTKPAAATTLAARVREE